MELYEIYIFFRMMELYEVMDGFTDLCPSGIGTISSTSINKEFFGYGHVRHEQVSMFHICI